MVSKAPPRPCTHPGCGALVHDGSGRCDRHKRKAWGGSAYGAGKRLYTGARLQEVRAHLFRSEPLCRLCAAKGLVRVAEERDHIVPLAQGGTDSDDNVQPLCKPCHREKSMAEAIRGRGAFGYGVQAMPKWMPRALVPVVVVCGPPASGKTTYVAERAAPGELILDLDVMASELSGKPLYHATREEAMAALRERNNRLSELARSPSCLRAWLIVTAGTPEHREFWAGLYGQPTVLWTPKSECVARIKADDRRPPDVKRRHINVVYDWW